MGENLFHPWCSDKQSRFAFLTGILQSHPTDSSVLCRALEGPSSTVFNTPHHDSDDETFISGLVTSFLQDPEELLTSLIGQSKLENVRSDTAKEMLLSKLKSQDEFQLHRALSCLLSAICRVDPNSPVLPSLHCLCSFTMESYVSRINQPLPQDISDHIINLSKLPPHHIYVFESLLPTKHFSELPYVPSSALFGPTTMGSGDKFLMEMLDMKDVSESVFRGERVFSPNTRAIYGGELMAQALMAASKTVPDGFKSHSLHCYFHDRASVHTPNDYHVTRFRDSRCFSHRLVEAFPVDKAKSADISPFFRMDCSFKVPEEDPAHFVAPMPKVPSAVDLMSTHTFIQNLPPPHLLPPLFERQKRSASSHSNLRSTLSHLRSTFSHGDKML
ncbi:unnamed protein product [Dicrocoelium dendriticum]|nr:unnamed protein product [Dicrocoelium dendriticum]